VSALSRSLSRAFSARELHHNFGVRLSRCQSSGGFGHAIGRNVGRLCFIASKTLIASEQCHTASESVVLIRLANTWPLERSRPRGGRYAWAVNDS